MVVTDGEKEMTSVRRGHEFDVDKLNKYLAGSLQGFNGPLKQIKQFKSGQSNPTFYLQGNTKSIIVAVNLASRL
jgi:aminoglycoside phosphotransferase (APT) family kinase protein